MADLKEFARCNVCKINHNQGRKHVYSRSHRCKTEQLLSKAREKVKECKANTKEVVIHDKTGETGAKTWCYFCQEEVVRDEQIGLLRIQDAGLLQHLCSEEHKANLLQFWKRNKIEEDEKRRGKLMLSSERYASFKQQAVIAIRTHEQGKRQKLEKETWRYKQQLARQQTLVTMATYLLFSQQESQGLVKQWKEASNKPQDTLKEKAETVKGFRTIAAQGEGLTCISVTNRDDSLGNVHSGAKPPWLSEGSEERSRGREEQPGPYGSGVIGPTRDTYQQHLEAEHKRKLPSNRVGAHRDRNESAGSDWLPMFGHVWSSAARAQQRKLAGTSKPSSSWTPQSDCRHISQTDEQRTWDVTEENDRCDVSDLNSRTDAETPAVRHQFYQSQVQPMDHFTSGHTEYRGPPGTASVLSSKSKESQGDRSQTCCHDNTGVAGYVSKRTPCSQENTVIKIASNLL